MIVWSEFDKAGRYNPTTNTWVEVPTVEAPAVGSEMIGPNWQKNVVNTGNRLRFP